MKHALVNAPVLAYPDMSKPFILTCDASDEAVGYVLGQTDDYNREYVIAYGNKALSKEQKNWTTTEKECLAILKGIEAYRPYLTNNRFTVVTDHNALVWLKSAKLTGKLSRWAIKLQDLNYDIVHRPGKSNVVADCLSRNPQKESISPSPISSDKKDDPKCEISAVSDEAVQTEVSDDGQIWTTEVTLFYEGEHVEDSHEIPVIAAVEVQKFENTVNNKVSLQELQKQCPDLSAIYSYLDSGDLPDEQKKRDRIVSESKFFTLSDGILYHWYQRRCRNTAMDDTLRHIKQIALPRCLHLDALKSYHDSLAAGGHLGIEKVRSSLLEKYWWFGMHQQITDYVKSCDRCQRAKRNCHPNRPPLTKMPAVGRFERWHIDILGPLTKTKEGYEYILLVVDSFSRWVEGFPLKTQSAKDIATALYENVITRYGPPRVLLSDRGQAFLSKIIKAICEIFQITQHHTSSYHANTNGKVERQNNTLAQCLRAYCDKDQMNWPALIPSILMAFRRAISSSTGFSPFYMMFGEEMRLPFDIALEPKDSLPQNYRDYLSQFIANLKIAHEIAQENEAQSKEKDKVRHDKRAQVQNFGIGDLVLLNVHKVPKGLSRKLCDKSGGPYRIEEIGPNYTYVIRRYLITKG